MKYGETLFDSAYLLLAVICGCVILHRARSGAEKKMGLAVLILGIGDAFHLVPRMIHYFSAADLTAALGVGKLVTSLTMTVFYVLLYYIWLGVFRRPEKKGITAAVWTLTVLRFALCLFPQNGWLRNDRGMTWGILRNVPFAVLGAIIICLYFRTRRENLRLCRIWLYVTLSFLFYIPVAVGAGAMPMLGMLMLPKTVCYILMILTFLLFVCKDRSSMPTDSD